LIGVLVALVPGSALPGEELPGGVRVSLRAVAPQITVTWPTGQRLDLEVATELGVRPRQRNVKPERVMAPARLESGREAVLRFKEGLALTVRVEAFDGVVRVQTLHRRVAGEGLPVYYYWLWPFPEELHQPDMWGRGVTNSPLPREWGEGGYRDWFHLETAHGGLGLVTPMYLLTSARKYGGKCYLKPFPIERRFLRVGDPGLEQQLVVWPSASVEQTADRWRRLMAREDLFRVPWRRVPESFSPGPEWLRKARLFQGWPYGWGGTTVDKRIRGFPLVIDAPIDAAIIDAARQAGSRTAVYVNVMEQWTPKPVEQRGYDRPVYEFTRLLGLPERPEWQALGADGMPRRSESRWWRKVSPCFLSPGYAERCLEAVDKVLEQSPDAIFIDNCFLRLAPCYGPKPGMHAHRPEYPNAMAAYRGLVVQMAERARAAGVAVLANSEADPGLWGVIDGQMYECLLYCPGWKQRNKSWTQMRYAGEMWAEAVRQGGTVLMLHYLGIEPFEHRLDACLLTYAWCQLYDLIWSDWYNLFEARDDQIRGTAQRLYRARLGPPLDSGPRYADRCLWRRFERGFVAVNPSREDAHVTLPWLGAPPMDLRTGRFLTPTDRRIEVVVPAQTGVVAACTEP